MFRTRLFVLVAALGLLIAFTGCGDEGTTATGSDEADQTEASEPEDTEDTDEPEEEEKSACLGKKKGPVTKVVAGKLAESFGAAIRFYPPKLKLPAGKVVTLNIVHGGGPAHTFTVDALDCDTGVVAAGDSVFVSFKVPAGVTPFYCQPHKSAGMDGEIIGVK